MSEYIIDSWNSYLDNFVSDRSDNGDLDEPADYYGICVGKITRCKDCESFCKTLRYRKHWPEIGKCNAFFGRRSHYVFSEDFCSGAHPKEEA